MNDLFLSFGDVWDTITAQAVDFALPVLIVASLILLGVLVGWLVKQAIVGLLDFINIRKIVERVGLDHLFQVKISWANLLGDLAQWVIVFAFLLWALQIFPATQGVQDLVRQVIDYLPRVIGAVVIVLIGAVVADLLSRFTVNAAKVLGATTAGFLGDVAKYAVLVTVFLTALVQLGVREEFLSTLYSALVWAVAGAFILAFGLGGQGVAGDVIERAKKNWPKHKK